MSATIGTRIGRYQVTGLIGKGGMGEVYRALDDRLGRDVAVKVLPAVFSSDAERLKRFDQEARAAGALNHPNVLAILDIGTQDGAPFIVSELLEGETLRDRLGKGPLHVRKVVELGCQVARGLAAAHAKGIVHRDLKPENLFVTRDGHVKILDFGLAKLVRRDLESGPRHDSLAATMTEVGQVLGTVGYMAPEQVRGEPTDHRADMFALGCVLHELATGQAPFHHATAADTMAAIVRDDLPPFPAELERQAPGLSALIRRCVEKSPADRFESARDLAFSLEAFGGLAAPAVSDAVAPPAGSSVEDISYQRVTFRRGCIWSARFTADAHSAIYGASWEGKPLEIFWAHIGNPEARTIGFRDTDLLSVSPQNEMAILLRTEFVTSFDRRGTLARVPPMGGAPRELLHDVHAADWSPDGAQLAVARWKEGMIRIEYPIGNVLFKTAGWVGGLRISPDGQHIVFVDHPNRNSDGGRISTVDRRGERRTLTEGWGTIRGLAWAPSGKEVWFTADRFGAARGLYATTLDGQLRRVLQVASNLMLHDISRDGRALLAHGQERAGINGLAPGETQERDLSWLDWSLVQDISSDGRAILLDETAEGGGQRGSVYLRPIDGSPAIRLGDGSAKALSPDGQWVAGTAVEDTLGLVLLPTGVGEPRVIKLGDLSCHNARWTPDQQRMVIAASEPGQGVRLYIFDPETGEREAFTPEGVDLMEFQVLPDGRSASVRTSDQEHRVYSFDGSDSRAVPHLTRTDLIVRWLPDGKSLLAYKTNELPARIVRIDLETGQRTPWRDLTPPDPTGIYRVGRLRTSHDLASYAYTYYMQLVDLHVVTGLR